MSVLGQATSVARGSGKAVRWPNWFIGARPAMGVCTLVEARRVISISTIG
ncbi:Uncharacterised protein [Bordetella pertussis]|nr:Uncharacterised protein [Bordetella pertussis]CFW01042.1 Uncharacterised protein [Bordetella pertussis]